MSSGLPLKADIAQCNRHVPNVPLSDSCTAAKAPYWITSSACAGNAAHRLSRRGGAGGIPRRPRRGACAHYRVQRADRDARHEGRSTRSRATSSTKLPPTAATARACTATKCGKAAPPLQRSDRGGFEARVTLPGSKQRLPRARELELRRPRHALRCYPYAFCNCLPQRTCI